MTADSSSTLPRVEQAQLPPAEIVAPPKLGYSAAQGIQYLESFRYVFTHPEWLKNVLVFTVFLFIPVFNAVLIHGYLYEIVEHRHRRLAGPYPLFEIRQFARYMTRGIWCFFVANIVQVILIPIIQVLVQGSTFGSVFALRSGDWGAVAVAIVVPLVIIGVVLFLLALQILTLPFFMRAGLSQDFRLTMNVRWVGNYLKAMWLETTLVSLFVFLSSLTAMFIGCMMACVGLFAALALMALVQAHLQCQLYALYLARGGEPIPLRPLGCQQ
ncbi:MAG: DUF4013 domain-containing protein [Planctomycetaceae bacterium]|nr:DUF4013 domain-containing protein [Planctomycetaceae bacterium]